MRRTMQRMSDRETNDLAEQIQHLRPGIDRFETTESDRTPTPSTPPSTDSTQFSWQAIDDTVAEADFEQSVRDLAASIHEEMRTYGDDEEDANDLKLVEFRIQSERIARLVDGCVENVQLGFVLPLMLSDTTNADFMEAAARMSVADRKRIMDIANEFARNEDSYVLPADTDIYTELEMSLRAADTCGLKRFVPDYIDKLSTEATGFLRTLNQFRKMAQLRIFWTAPKAMAKEKRLYAMWTDNISTREMVRELHAKVDATQRLLKDRMSKSEGVMEEYQRKVAELNEQNAYKIEKIIYESNLKMNKTSIDSEHKQQELLSRANKSKEEYETMLRENLVTGRKLRENKLKMQQKLQSWLLKYDTEVGDRSKELFKLKDQLDDERNEFRKWMIKFEEQETEFLDVEAQILAEFIRQRDEKVRIFAMNFAARTIQRALRRFLKKRKAARKKAMRKKGKK